MTKRGDLEKPGFQDLLNIVFCAYDKIQPHCVGKAFTAVQIFEQERAADTDIIANVQPKLKSAETLVSLTLCSFSETYLSRKDLQQIICAVQLSGQAVVFTVK